MGDVLRLDTDWFGPVAVKDVIEGAAQADFDHVFIVGEKDGELVLAADFAAKADILWLIEKVKHDLLDGRWG